MLVARSTGGTKCASARMPKHLCLPKLALLNWQGVRTHSKMSKSWAKSHILRMQVFGLTARYEASTLYAQPRWRAINKLAHWCKHNRQHLAGHTHASNLAGLALADHDSKKAAAYSHQGRTASWLKNAMDQPTLPLNAGRLLIADD